MATPANEGGTAICPVCDTRYLYRIPEGQPPPRCCGVGYCRAMTEWTPEQWAGRARMVAARQAVDADLNDWDREALRRSPNPKGWAA